MKAFAAARREGHLAAILDRADADVHTLRVTRIPAGEAVTVRFTLEETLTAIDGDWQWRFPTVIAPRYLPGEAIGHTGPGVLPDTDRVPLGSHLPHGRLVRLAEQQHGLAVLIGRQERQVGHHTGFVKLVQHEYLAVSDWQVPGQWIRLSAGS